MKGSWFNFIYGIITILALIPCMIFAKDNAFEILLMIICGLLYAIFLQLADMKNKK